MKYLIVVAMLVLSFGIVTAYDVDYKEKFSMMNSYGDFEIVSKTVWVDYTNEKRYSTRDYRHGYSYRSTGDYFDRKYSDVFYKKKSRSLVSFEKKSFGNYHDKSYFDSGLKGHSYKYVPHLRSYEKRDCYVIPPKDKLFYFKC